DCYVVAVGEQAKTEAVRLVYELRRAGLRVDQDYLGRKMKAQLKAADRLGASFVAMIGDEELESGAATVKDMASGEQMKVPFGELAHVLAKRTGREE
ncbi:His/Gly/Thr/Pro-type tRNA ligase C-terminal domain-containing protein, partial [Anoxybacillus geothermalis]|nr:His/Gly/Thr/Pro-type tRNA ligase C-terminal domain-containing protein [Anoxybacillus geothermalis]